MGDKNNEFKNCPFHVANDESGRLLQKLHFFFPVDY